MTTPVKPEPIGRVLTGDEWEAAQYAPHRLTSDPKKPLPPGRVLTGDEWEQAQRSGSLRSLTFPAMPKFAADATRRLNPNSGEQDRTPTEYLGDAIREYASDIEHAPSLVPGTQGVQQLAGILGRQVVAPVVEHPIMTAAMLNPVGGVVGGMMAAHTVAKYGWQVAHESQMTPEERAEAQKDPERVSGEAAAVQAVMLGLGAIAGVRAARSVGDVGAGMMEAGARGVRETDFGLTAEAGDAAQTANLRARVTESARRYFETEKGAEVLGTTAGAHGLPETASPFPPASALDVAWKQGHSAAQPEVAPHVTPEPASSGSVQAPKTGGGLTPIEGTGETVPRGSARSIERKAVEDGLVQSLGELPQYERANMAHHADLAVQLLADDPVRARRIALGEEPAPAGMIPEAVSIAVENKALAEGDAATLHDIATGGLVKEATTMGQRIRTLGERNPESPVDAIKSVVERRSGGANAKKLAASTVKDIEKNTELNLKSLMDFFDSVKC